MSLTNADRLHATVDLTNCDYLFTVQNSFSGALDNYKIGDFNTDENKQSMISVMDITIPFDSNDLVPSGIAAKILTQSLVQFYVTHIGESTDFQRIWAGRLDSYTIQSDSISLKCYDRIYDLRDSYFNFGTFEAERIKLTPQESIPDPPDDLQTVNKAILLVPVTEAGETRYVIPWHLDSDLSEYQQAYSTGVGDADYTGSVAGFTYKAGINRRSWRSIGRLYDTDGAVGMDLDDSPNDLGQKISYNNPAADYTDQMPVPRTFYQVGTDLSNYIEILPGYTVVGDLYLEWVEVYVEGTNDIEHILMKSINPRIQGVATTGSAGSDLVAAAARFMRDGILVGGSIKIKGTADSTAELITSVDQDFSTGSSSLTSDGSQGLVWAVDTEFEIFNAVATSVRWKDGTDFNLSGAYGTRTIWPSLITINSFEWNASDGSVYELWTTLIRQYAPPNYKPWWCHEQDKLYIGFTEITPFSNETSYYETSPPYGAFKIPADIDSGGVGSDEYVSLIRNQSSGIPVDLQTFKSHIIVEGVNEHNTNELITGDAVAYTFPVGATTAGWNFTGGQFSDEWVAQRRDEDDIGIVSSYADIQASDYIDIKDLNVDTGLAWVSTEYPPESESRRIVPFLVIDRFAVKPLGAIDFTTLWSKNDFPFTIKIECCDENGLSSTGGQIHYNPAAAWTLISQDWAGQQVSPWKSERIAQFAKSSCRYILFSMSYAKIHDKKHHAVGFSDVGIFGRQIVTGQARVTDLSSTKVVGIMDGVDNDSVPNNSQLIDDDVDLIAAGVQVFDPIYNLTQGFTSYISGGLTVNQIWVFHGENPDLYWNIGDRYSITGPDVLGVGDWKGFQGTGSDDALYLINLPFLNQILIGEYTDSFGAANISKSGHKTAYVIDHSIGNTNAAAIRAAETLLETLRQFQSLNGSCKWHNDLRLYRTAILYHYPTGTVFRGLVESLQRSRQGCSVKLTNYTILALTNEPLNPVPE